MILEIVQNSFCKSPLELVVYVPICNLSICEFVFVFCGPVLWTLHCVIICSDQFDILWHATLGPICGVLYIFYYAALVLLTFYYRVATLIVDNNMYIHLV